MQKYNKILLALDRSDTDLSMLRYVKLLTNYYKPSLIQGIHVVPTLNQFYADFVQKNESAYEVKQLLDGVLKEELLKHMTFYFSGDQKDIVDVAIVEGKPVSKLLEEADSRGIDLLVVGNKKASLESGVTAKSVSRRFNKSTLFVPENMHTQMHQIVVPIDFSENSARALREALDIYTIQIGASIVAIHVIDSLPFLHYQTISSNKLFETYLRKDIYEVWDKFCKKYDLPQMKIKFEIINQVDQKVAKAVHEYVQINKSDLIIIGHQGHSKLSLMLMGSNTEKLLGIEKETPILIVK